MKFYSAAAIGVALCLGAGVSAASAQATRTWVSGTGDDANPCSRTAPCKTFAGAISKTAAGGEIDALDAGGFGTVTVTKAITIDGGAGQVASVLATGTTGFTVNAGSSDSVILRNLTISGAGNPLGANGVNLVAAAALTLQNVKIFDFSNFCLNAQPATTTTITLLNSSFQDCTSGGVIITTTDTTPVRLSMSNSKIARSNVGLTIGNAHAVVEDSSISGNATGGALVNNSTGELILQSSSVSNNPGYGITASGGGRAALSAVNVTLNGGPSFVIDKPNHSSVVSWGNSYVAGNTPDAMVSNTIAPQ